MSGSERTPPDLTPQEAVERWLDRQSMELAASSAGSYARRMEHFTEWCDDEDVEHIADLRPWDIGAYEDHRRAVVTPVSLNNELTTLRQLLDWAAGLGLIDEAVVEAVDPPRVDKAEQVSETLLEPDRGEALLAAFRSGDGLYTREHAWLELSWWTGARMGSIRGLDVDDVDLDDGYVQFRHRPDEETPLKNGYDGERIVGISETVADVLAEYLDRRPHTTDDYGRRPVFATGYGRIAGSTLRDTCYYATHPCRQGPCPHEKERLSCEHHSRTKGYGCPSARSPHEIRSGSITWQLHRGLSKDVVSDRVNATIEVIERHYDQARQIEEFERRRAAHLDKLGIDSSEENE
ncbi:tyrosine-type recombinase/integrase [Haloplanus ruber]|uniref:Tyrosine-type recombinase/integrase n=1 Tax=Haloplanus ruber TaxID=869892 RepID=A0ABD6D1X1_9EURY|nr:tyrosine-type recombinase/integrase [Haloplanus ruber]